MDNTKLKHPREKLVISCPVPGLSTFKWTKETDKKLDAAIERVKELEKL